MASLKITLETEVEDLDIRNSLLELVDGNVQRSNVAKSYLEEITKQLAIVFNYKLIIDDIVDKFSPKEIKKKYEI
ncbi:Hypothetical protein CINCED_3A021867 [Cinara cedri]|uniref:Uncharacterized protein n=1 Tax=Cinara cedri TaxID=506608 RepID=A0A5E4NGT2_9HEMI|nr:Hypothetical protein CINCED_3A021867 [Cinara cedri]